MRPLTGWLSELWLYVISMIDDATSRPHARFVLHDSTAESMRLRWSYLERYARPVSFYTDKPSLFQTAPMRTLFTNAGTLSVYLSVHPRDLPVPVQFL
jgi:hypothetical protein